MKKTLSLLLAFMMVMSMMLSVSLTASAFNPDNYKAQIKSISVGAPITGLDGKKYLPVDVHFTANEDLGDKNAVYFLEGILKGMLSNGDEFEGISGLGMTLMGPLKPDALEGAGSNSFSWNWSEGYGEGTLKYNIPLKDDEDTQSIEKSQATGQQEVNVLQPGDKVNFQIETVMNSSVIPSDILPEGGSLFSNEAEITLEEAFKYPKNYEIVAYDTTEPETEETTAQATTEPATEAGTTEATEPVTDKPTEAATAATEPSTEIPEVTTEAPQATTEPVQPTTEAPTDIVVVEPTTQPVTGVEPVTVNPTTPGGNPTQQPTTEAPSQDVVVEPTQPASESSAQPETAAPTTPVVKPTQSAAQTKEPVSIKKAKVNVGKVSAYNGKAKMPAVTVTLGGKKLSSKEDYMVTYSNNKNAGKGKIVVKGIGDYKDSITVKFTIAKAKNTGKTSFSTAAVKAKKLKNKTQKAVTITVKNAKGEVKYTIEKKGTSKKIYKKLKINSKGVLSVKKWTKVKTGTYKVKIKVTIKGNKNYKPVTVTKTLKIKIK